MDTKKSSVNRSQKYKFKAVVHETDERMFYLKSMLDDERFSTPTHVFAPNVLVEAKTLSDVEDGATVYLSRCLDDAKMLANSRDITIFSFSSDEKFQAVNSRLTAEGALAILIEHSKKSVADCHVLVIGFGRTGAAVTKILCKLDVAIDVATSSSLRPAHAFAKRILPMHDFDFSPYDAVINTAPSPLVSDKELMSMAKDSISNTRAISASMRKSTPHCPQKPAPSVRQRRCATISRRTDYEDRTLRHRLVLHLQKPIDRH